MKKSRKILFALLAGFCTAFAFEAGKSLDQFDTLHFKDPELYIGIVLATILATAITYAVWEGITCLREQKLPRLLEKVAKGKTFSINIKRTPSYALCIILMLLCWLPALLSIWPGVFSYDAYDEWQQIVNGAITAHHPVLHVVLLGGLVEGIRTLTGSYNAGIATYSILQMAILANIFATSIRLMRKEQKISPVWQWFALLFFCLSPVVQLFSICATKDILFAGAQLLFFQYALIFYQNPEHIFANRKHLIGLGLSAFFTMTLRNNGLYIVLIVGVLMFIRSFRKYRGLFKKFAIVCLAVLLGYGIYVGPVYGLLGVEKGGVQEMLSVPLQQMARVYRYEYDSLAQEDLNLLYEIVPQENLESYRPTVADFVKSGFNQEAFEEHKVDFFKLWIKWGVKHPLTYVNSFLVNTVDGWYPKAVIDGYRNDKNNYYDYRVAEPGTEVVLLPKVHEYYDSISHDREVQENGWSFLFLSPGWYFVLFLQMLLYNICHKRYDTIVPFMVPMLNFLTVLLGPMALVRYVLIFFYGLPLGLAITINKDE